MKGMKNISLDFKLSFLFSLLLCLFALAIPLTFCQAQIQAQVKADKPPPTQDYVIGPEDILRISVWDHPDLSRERDEVVVSLEGYISFPLVGQVLARDLTTSQLEQKLCQLLADGYIVDPQVRVTVVEYKSKLIYVLGEVQKPGAYPLTRKEITLVEAISMAKGVTQDAGPEAIIVRPQKPKHGNPHPIEMATKEELITANLGALLEGNLQENLAIRSGDTIYVPRTKYFFIIGEVTKPGRYILESGTTVLKAIGVAGGLTVNGAKNKIKILVTV